MRARRPNSTILPRFIHERVCALTTLPFILFNIFLLILGLWSRTLQNFCCWMLHVLSKSILSCAVSGHFRDSRTVRPSAADGPPFKSQFQQRACNLCLPAKNACRQYGFSLRTVRRRSQKLYQNPPRNSGRDFSNGGENL